MGGATRDGWGPAYGRSAALLALALLVSACGPTKQEPWNSYYYGSYAQDNDATYQPPTQGSWQDNQTPQGMKWR